MNSITRRSIPIFCSFDLSRRRFGGWRCTWRRRSSAPSVSRRSASTRPAEATPEEEEEVAAAAAPRRRRGRRARRGWSASASTSSTTSRSSPKKRTGSCRYFCVFLSESIGFFFSSTFKTIRLSSAGAASQTKRADQEKRGSGKENPVKLGKTR